MKRVVVIGGGFAGAYIAKNLEKDFEVILIDSKDYFEFTPGILRTIVEPVHIKKIQVLHRHYLKKARFIRAHIHEITLRKIIFKKKRILFDYLVVCSGSGYNVPIKEEDILLTRRAYEMRDYYHRLCNSKKILIIGGGIVGVELAAEIVGHYRNKEVVMVHSKDKLMERMNPRAQKYSEEFLKKRGVKLIFNEKVISKKDKEYITNNGTKIETDMTFLCAGIAPNFDLFKRNFLDKLDKKNRVKVNKYFQVEGLRNIFAAGDITNVNEEKTAQNAENHASIVVKNIRSLENNEKLHMYKLALRPMVISLGKKDGIFTYKNIIFYGIIPAMLKNFVEWKTMRRYK